MNMVFILHKFFTLIANVNFLLHDEYARH